MEKAYVDENNKITIRCPRCGHHKVLDVSSILAKKQKGLIKVSYKFKCNACKCGHIECKDCNADCANGNTNVYQLERRKFFRKDVKLEGTMDCGEIKNHKITVLNLSRTGMKMATRQKDIVSPGKKCQAQFQLDDAKKTLIKKELRVKSVDGHTVDCEFTDTQTFDSNDKAIGFYLMK